MKIKARYLKNEDILLTISLDDFLLRVAFNVNSSVLTICNDELGTCDEYQLDLKLEGNWYYIKEIDDDMVFILLTKDDHKYNPEKDKTIKFKKIKQ